MKHEMNRRDLMKTVATGIAAAAFRARAGLSSPDRGETLTPISARPLGAGIRIA